MRHEQRRLSNGLETLFIDCPGATSATVQIWFRAGSVLESAKNRGIAHFLEHMFFRGTAKRPGSMIAHEVESFGGEINAFTSFDYTCYYINTPHLKLDQTIDILLDMVSNPQFKDSDIKPERGVVFEEFRRSIDSPNQYNFHRLQKQCFAGNYAHEILGTEKTIKNFSREQLIEFRKNHYNLSNALFVIAGDIEGRYEKLEKQIEAFKLPEGPSSKLPNLKLKNHPTIDIHNKDVRMAQMTFAIQASPFNNKNATSEDLALNCLGHGETSKLHRGMVLENSIANSCGASTLFMNNGGVHLIRISFPPQNLDIVTNKLEEIIADVLKNGMTKDQVKRIKLQYIASKVYDMESIESRAFSLGHGFAQNNDINSEDEFIQRMKKVTLSEVNHSLREIFSRPIHIGVQIPKDQKTSTFKRKVETLQTKLQKLQKSMTPDLSHKYPIEYSKFDKQVQLISLKKGIKLLHRHNTMTPTFSMHTYLRGGITEETKNNNGIYHLLCALMTKGFKNKKYDALQEELEEMSASLSGFSGKNAYGLTLHGQSDHFTKLSDLFFQSLLRPLMPAKFLKHEKEMALRSLENQKEDPVRVCFKELSKIFFNKHPYSQALLGTKESLKKISREKVHQLHEQNLKHKEILITYCGDLEAQEVIETILPHIDSLKPRNEKKLQFKKYTPQKPLTKHLTFNREQTHIFTGIPCGKLEDEENLYLKMLTAHLSGQSSELFVEVRDRQGLCYTAQPVHFMALEGGYWGIYMASGHDKATLAKEALKNLIEKIRKHGLSKSEFTRIKDMIEGQALINVQTNEDYANIYAIPTLQGQGLDYYHQSNKQIRSLRHSDFQKGIKKVLSKEFSHISVGSGE